jgi:hypothetical protein
MFLRRQNFTPIVAYLAGEIGAIGNNEARDWLLLLF